MQYNSPMEELTFRTEKRKKTLQYLMFLPRQLRGLALFAIISNLINIILTAVSFPFLQEVIPLFYSLANDQQLISKIFIFILPFFATIVNLTHLSIARLARDSNLTILRIFIIATLVIQLLTLGVLIRTITIIS